MESAIIFNLPDDAKAWLIKNHERWVLDLLKMINIMTAAHYQFAIAPSDETEKNYAILYRKCICYYNKNIMPFYKQMCKVLWTLYKKQMPLCSPEKVCETLFVLVDPQLQPTYLNGKPDNAAIYVTNQLKAILLEMIKTS